MKKLEEEIHIDEEIFGLRNLVDIENRFKQYSNHYSSKGGTETLYNINIPSPKDNSPKTHEGSIWDDHFSHRHHDKILTRNMKRSYTRSPTGWRMQDDREQ